MHLPMYCCIHLFEKCLHCVGIVRCTKKVVELIYLLIYSFTVYMQNTLRLYNTENALCKGKPFLRNNMYTYVCNNI